MPISVKVIFTVAITTLMFLLLFMKSNLNNAGLDANWRGGKNDLARRLLFRSDGSLRFFAKSIAIGIFCLFLFFIWFVLPIAKAPH